MSDPAATRDGSILCTVGLPVLAGEKGETLFVGAHPSEMRGDFEVQTCGHWRIGRASVAITEGAEQPTYRLYRSLLSGLGDLHLCRIWNYLPRINEADADGLENYRSFCRGRSLAFEEGFGLDFQARLPAASAVGTDDHCLTVVFAACDTAPRHFENPGQVPAYAYPAVYGPRSPSFSRATRVPDGPWRADVFISGTSSIEGHETVAAGDTMAQVACTLRNLSAISRTCGLGEFLAAGGPGERHFKVYLRSEKDLRPVQTVLASALLRPGDKVSYLRADICRAELNIEIEVTIMGAAVG